MPRAVNSARHEYEVTHVPFPVLSFLALDDRTGGRTGERTYTRMEFSFFSKVCFISNWDIPEVPGCGVSVLYIFYVYVYIMIYDVLYYSCISITLPKFPPAAIPIIKTLLRHLNSIPMPVVL